MTRMESGSEPASTASTSPQVHTATTTELNRCLPLVDRFARVHRSIRISVTDRCNIRCQYCMPAGDIQFLNEQRLLDFDSITQFVSTVSEAGVRKVRITGGEPLMRPRLEELIAKLNAIPTIEDIALTTNGMLLADKAEALRDAGLKRINISLDTLRDETFRRLSRRDGLDKVLAGIAAATERTRWEVRLNALVMRDINLNEVYELVEFAGERGLTMRFIEFMPLDADRAWTKEQMVSGAELRELLQSRFGLLTPIESTHPERPSRDYRFSNGWSVGFIDSVSHPFCSTCDRLRLTAEGKLRNCLFGMQEWDVRSLINKSSEELMQVVRECVSQKRAAHGMDAADFHPPERAMYQIGG